MNSRDISTICSVVLRLAGIPLIIWGPTKETFYIGVALLMGGEVGAMGRALIPVSPKQIDPPDKPPAKKKPRK